MKVPKINKNKESEKDGEAWLLSQAESNDLFERGREITFHLEEGAPSVQFAGEKMWPIYRTFVMRVTRAK